MNNETELEFTINACKKWIIGEPVSHIDFERITNLLRRPPLISHLEEDEMAALKARWLATLQEVLSSQ